MNFVVTHQDLDGIWDLAEERRQEHGLPAAHRDAGYDERHHWLQSTGKKLQTI